MEKKLTDEEIVKAFEHCNKSLPHDKCLLAEQHKEDWVTCQSKCGRMIIDLIHRLQDENKDLRQKNEKLYELGLNENTARFEDMKKIERLEDAVEGLTAENKVLHQEKAELQKQVDEVEQLLLITKTNKSIEQKKTVKEYAEKLKLRLFEYMDNDVSYDEFCKANVVCGEIDDIAKEYYGVEVE